MKAFMPTIDSGRTTCINEVLLNVTVENNHEKKVMVIIFHSVQVVMKLLQNELIKQYKSVMNELRCESCPIPILADNTIHILVIL